MASAELASGDQASGGDNIQVFVRIRPPCDEPSNSRVVRTDPSRKQLILEQAPTPRIFSFDHVVDIDDTQDNIFSRIGKKLIENCVAGYNGTIFAYGQTGSGKTYTMLGPTEDASAFHHEQRGVIPRSFEYLYSLINREKEVHGDKKQFLCKCSFLEIYNEQIFDLLEPSRTSLQLREGLKTGVYVSGLAERVVTDASEAYEVLSSSWMNRRVAATSMNRESSRSHAVFSLQIESKEKKGAVEHICTSRLNLVDLAGSERQKDTGTTGIRLKEAGSINKSLSNLGHVIMSLVSASREGAGSKRFIPYRDSKLTLLLRNSFGGNSRTKLIACVHPGQRSFGETLSTLLFASRAKMIKNKAVRNEDMCRNYEQMQAEILNLRGLLRQAEARGLVTQANPATPGGTSMLKNMFIKAMFLQQKTEAKKNELGAEVKKWKEVCDKKDNCVQTNKMVIKFRENNIQRLQSQLKGEEAPDTRIMDLQTENSELRRLIDHHPEMVRLNMEIHKLRTSLKDLRGENGVMASVEADRERVKELFSKYHELCAEEAAEEEGEKYVTPQRSEGVSTATVEKYKSQLSEIEADKEEIQKQLASMQKEMEVKLMKLTSELESKKTYISELEMVIAANSTKTKIEIAALNEKHLQTVKTITTPKKEAYNLRNRVVSKSESPDLNSTIPFEEPELNLFEAEDGILSSVMATEALQTEIKQLQDEKSEMAGRLTEYESERVKSTSQVDLLTKQVKQLEEMIQQESDNKSESLLKTEETLKKALEDKRAAEDTTEELNLLWAHCDKELKETKEKAREVDKLRSKNAELAITLASTVKQKETFEERITALEEEIEATICTTTFRETQISALEQDLEEARAKVQEAESQFSMLRQETQQKEVHQISRTDELQLTLAVRDKLIMELQEAAKVKELKYEQQEKENASMLSNLTAQMDILRVEKSELETQALDLEEKLQHQEDTRQDLKRQLMTVVEKLEQLNREKTTWKFQEDNYEMDISSLKEENERLLNEQTVIEEARAKLEVQVTAQKESIETMVNMNEHTKLVYQLESLEILGRQKTEEIEKLKVRLTQTEEEKAVTLTMMSELQKKHEEKVDSLGEDMAQQTRQMCLVKEQYEQLESKFNHMRLDFDGCARDNSILETENQRLKDVSLKDKEELAEINSVMQQIKGLYNGELSTDDDLVKVIKTTKTERDHLDGEMSGIVGHANHKQKIRLHENLKNERDFYKKELGNTNLKCKMLQEKLREMECNEKHGFLNKGLQPERALKENKLPSHKTFLSGDFT